MEGRSAARFAQIGVRALSEQQGDRLQLPRARRQRQRGFPCVQHVVGNVHGHPLTMADMIWHRGLQSTGTYGPGDILQTVL